MDDFQQNMERIRHRLDKAQKKIKADQSLMSNIYQEQTKADKLQRDHGFLPSSDAWDVSIIFLFLIRRILWEHQYQLQVSSCVYSGAELDKLQKSYEIEKIFAVAK